MRASDIARFLDETLPGSDIDVTSVRPVHRLTPGVGPGQRVCVAGERKVEFITGVLAGFACRAAVLLLAAGDAAVEA